jgi:mono/diheme cytochrome c family protein
MRRLSLILKQLSKSVLLIAGLAIMATAAHGQGDATKGQGIFKANCTTCHAIGTKVVGPALGPQVTTVETDDKWLTKWIQNNQALIAAKDPKALAIYNQYNQSGMTVFGSLSDGDVADVLAYIRSAWKTDPANPAAPKAPGTATAPVDNGPGSLTIYALIAVIVIAFIIILVLNRVIGTLEKVLVKSEGTVLIPTEAEVVAVDRFAAIKKLAKNKKFVFFVTLCGTLALGSWTWVTMWNTNVHQGYQPEQPIHFPHDLHAGAMQINCQYCHFGAYKSKNAGIPPLNVCMNCHKTVKTESPEIHKIYDALGYDPATSKYDSTKARPIQWVRVHNLPDLVYFNHSQHVKVAGLACQTCHGPVQNMKEIYQYSPLTMKWCIQCHKRTNVNMKGNAYYEKMEAVHDLIKAGKPVTEAAMGGIECGKCHY